MDPSRCRVIVYDMASFVDTSKWTCGKLCLGQNVCLRILKNLGKYYSSSSNCVFIKNNNAPGALLAVYNTTSSFDTRIVYLTS